MKCSISYCCFPVYATKLCSRHYQAKRKYGDPEIVRQKQFHGLTPTERFFKYVKQSPECWEWVGSKCKNGYGRLNVNGTPVLASRLSFQIHHGSIPQGLNVCHKCDNPACVNPKHLFLGTQQDNVDDMKAKGRERHRCLAGEQHPNSRLTVDAVRAIRASTETGVELSRRFNISLTVIYDIRNGKIWRGVK